MSFSDRRAVEGLNSRYVKYYKQGSSKWNKLLDGYITANGDPDPLWPLVLILRYRALIVEPEVGIESSRRCIEDPEIIAKAREGTGILVYWIIADGQSFVRKAELVDL